MNYLNDNEILDGLRQHDEHVTHEYFYGICRMAYCIFDRRYSLSKKPGMDFYSLAHEYYLTLCADDWRQLEDRGPTVTLRSWMIGGFRFLMLDRLKHARREEFFTSIDNDDRLQFDVIDSNMEADVRQMVDEICNNKLNRNSRESAILHSILIDGYQGREIAQRLGITPSAVSQQFQRLMRQIVIPYFKTQFTKPDEGTVEHALYSIVPTTVGAIHLPKGSLMSKLIEHKRRITPRMITQLAKDEVFVFGSNLAGMHYGGAALTALQHFGAKLGVGVGPQGQSYAIPTMQGGVETIAPYVNEFIDYALEHPKTKFLVTAIGCGIAGFDAEEIAPLFRRAEDVDNIYLPEEFWDVL